MHCLLTDSALLFIFLSATVSVVPELGVHNIFLADQYKESFDSIFVQHAMPEEPSFYLNVPSRIDPSYVYLFPSSPPARSSCCSKLTSSSSSSIFPFFDLPVLHLLERILSSF